MAQISLLNLEKYKNLAQQFYHYFLCIILDKTWTFSFNLFSDESLIDLHLSCWNEWGSSFDTAPLQKLWEGQVKARGPKGPWYDSDKRNNVRYSVVKHINIILMNKSLLEKEIRVLLLFKGIHVHVYLSPFYFCPFCHRCQWANFRLG